MVKDDYINLLKMTSEENERIDRLRKKDEITNNIITNTISYSKSDFIKIDLIELLERSSFEKNEYYIAAEALFNLNAPTEWIELVVKVIHEKGEDDIENYIREVVDAFKSDISIDVVENCINLVNSPSEVHCIIEEKINDDEMRGKVTDTIEKLPMLVEKIDNDNNLGAEKYKEIQKQLEEKNSKLSDVERQLAELTEKITVDNQEEYKKLKKAYGRLERETEYYKNKCLTALDEKEALQNECTNYRIRLLKSEKENTKLTDLLKNKSNGSLEKHKCDNDDIKKFINNGLDSVMKVVSSNYNNLFEVISKVNSVVDDTITQKCEKNSDLLKDLFALNKDILSEVENIATSNNAVSSDTVEYGHDSYFDNVNENPYKDLELEMADDLDVVNENIECKENEISNVEVNADVDSIHSICEDEVYNDKLNDNLHENMEDTDIQENFEIIESSADELNQSRNMKICKVDEMLENKVLVSSKNDEKETQKISMFSGFKFRISSKSKQKQLIIGLMMKKKYNMDQIKCVKEILDSENVENKFIFDLINRDDTKPEDLMKLLAFTTVGDDNERNE